MSSNNNHKKIRVAIPMSDKIDFKTRNGTREKTGTVYNGKRFNMPGKYNNCKHICM